MRDEIVRKNVLINVIAMLAILIVSIFIISSISLNSLKQSLVYVSNNITSEINSNTDYSSLIEKYASKSDLVSISIGNADGKIIIDSEQPIETLGEYSFSSEEIKLIKNNDAIDRIYVENNIIYLISSIPGDCMIRIGMEMESTSIYVLDLIFTILIVMAMVIILTYRITDKFSKNIKNSFDTIEDYLRTINTKEFKEITIDSQYDEVNDALKEIKKIYKSIIYYIQTIDHERNRSQFIIDNINHGLVLMDENKNIIMMNNYLLDNFHLSKNSTYDQIFSNAEFQEKLNKSIETRTDIYFDFVSNIDKKVYFLELINVDMDDNTHGYIIRVVDVNELRKQDKIKQQFISNASHELKTPITAISGFSELLLMNTDKLDEKTVKYLNIINKEALNMKSIIEDFLLLSKVESNDKVEYENVNTTQLISDVVDTSISLAAKENIKIITDIEDINFRSNYKMLRHIISNLVENAIKYNRADGSVNIKVSEKKKKVTFEVLDTGIGLEKKEFDKIFERFYRVDKAHTRSNKSGTGLGLNIVKQMTMLLNGKIELESEYGVGSVFTVTFNKD